MLSRSTPCLWITFFCLHLCCHVDSGEAQNAKEGEFRKFGLASHPIALGKDLRDERRGAHYSAVGFFVFVVVISPL